MQITIQTDAWKHVLETTVNALKSGALYMPPADNQNSNQAQMYENYLKQNLFVVGRLAMTMDGSYLMDNLRRAKDTLKDITPVNWDIVTVPVNPQNPEYSNTVSVSQIFAVNAQSTNTRAAWNFVKYINSDEYAKIMSKTSQAMLTRTTYSKEKDGHSLEPFYLLKPNPDTPYKSFEKIPVEFYQPFSTLAEQEIKAVMDGKKSTDEALKTIQEKGQEALLSAKQQQDSKATAEPK
jgi:multiple sugar transport system substrate-binding protein